MSLRLEPVPLLLNTLASDEENRAERVADSCPHIESGDAAVLTRLIDCTLCEVQAQKDQEDPSEQSEQSHEDHLPLAAVKLHLDLPVARNRL